MSKPLLNHKYINPTLELLADDLSKQIDEFLWGIATIPNISDNQFYFHKGKFDYLCGLLENYLPHFDNKISGVVEEEKA